MSLIGGAFGGAVGGATVKLFLDKSQFDRGMAQAKGETKAGSTAMGKFAGAAKAAFAVAGAAAVAFAISSVKAFMESETVMAQFQSTLSMMPQLAGETTQAFEDQATALQNLTGYQDEEIISADSILARFKLTGEQIRAVIPTVLDFARATGRTVPDAASAIGKALLGNTRALKDVGIEFTRTGDTARDFNSILGLMQDKVAGSAEAFGETLAGKMEIAKAKLDDFKESIGAFLGSGLLLLTGNVRDAAAMWTELGDVTEDTRQRFIDITNSMKMAGDVAAMAALVQIQPTLNWIDTMAQAAEGANAMGTSEDRAAFAADGLSTAMKNLNDQLRTSWELENQLSGGLVGLAQADANATQARRDFAAAQATVNKLAVEGKKGTQEYKDAVLARNSAELASLQSQQDLEGSAQSLYAEFQKGNVTLSEAETRLRAQAAAAGLSTSQTNALVREVDALYAAGSRIPSDVSTTFAAPGLDSQMSALVRYWQQLSAIPTHKDVYIVTHYSSVGTPGTAGGPQ